MDRGLLNLVAGERRISRKGHELRILSAWELMQARREAEDIPGEKETEALRRNAAILSRAVYRGGMRMFSSGRAVLEQWSGEKIGAEMAAYRKLAQQVDPDCGQEERVRTLMKELEQEPMERIRWYVLKAFGVLPTEKRAREMTEGDFLYCALQLMLDGEERKRKMCPACREKLEEHRCSCCGGRMENELGDNPQFDINRFEEMKRDG